MFKMTPSVPDGGWGWYVVFGTALINMFNQSLVSIFGLLLGPKIEKMAGPEGVSKIMSISIALLNFSGIAIGPLTQVLTTRRICQIGVILVAIGMIISGYAQMFDLLILGYGVFSGLGLGIISSATFLIINSYFNKNKTGAVGISMAGTTIGQIMLPIIIALVKDPLGTDNTIYLLALTSSIGILGTFLFSPVENHVERSEAIKKLIPFSDKIEKVAKRFQKKKNIENGETAEQGRRQDQDSETNNCEGEQNNPNMNFEDFQTRSDNDLTKWEKVEIQNTTVNVQVEIVETVNNPLPINPKVIKENIRNRVDHKNDINHIGIEANTESNVNVSALNEKNKEANTKQEYPQQESRIKNCIINTKWYLTEMKKGLDFRLLKDFNFTHTILGLALTFTTNTSFSTYFPLFLKNEMNISAMDVSSCLSILSAMDFMGRLLIPFVAKHLNISPRTTFLYGLLILSIMRSVTVMQHSYGAVFLCAGATGFARSAPVVTQNVIMADCCKRSKVPSGLGLFMIFKGILILIIGNSIGWFQNYFMTTYSLLIHFLNIISTIVLIFWCSYDLMNRLNYTTN